MIKSSQARSILACPRQLHQDVARRERMWLVGLVLLLFLGTRMAYADVYKCPDSQGKMHYQNAPCTGDDAQPILKTEEPPSSTVAPPRNASPHRAPARATQDSLQSERETRQQTRRHAIRSVRLEEVREEARTRGFILRGKVRNEGRSRVDRVKIRVEWQDNTGKVLDTSFTTVVGSEGLEPQQAKSWTSSAPRDARITKYRVYILED